jgi:hypothetical protein
MSQLDADEAARYLDEQDKINNINKPVELPEEITEVSPRSNLGVVDTYSNSLELSSAAESSWKLLDLRSLPTQGLFYPENCELLLRPAKTKEIRHWSTIDENDPLDVREKINFILNSCTKFKVRGSVAPLNYNDFAEVDRYHILFRIYELTFPNQENKLWANIKCENTKCKHTNRAQVLSQNLKGFSIPAELMKWYSPEEKCFKIVSDKLQETIRIYMPTIGIENRFNQRNQKDLENGVEIDKAFYDFGPYLVKDWRTAGTETLSTLKMSSLGWPENKFVFIHKFTKQLKDASLNKALVACEKCKEATESHIFLEGSFTVKDIFIISAGLDELI